MTKELHVNIVDSQVESIRLEDRIKELEAWQAEARPLLRGLVGELRHKKKLYGMTFVHLHLGRMEESIQKIEKLIEGENDE